MHAEPNPTTAPAGSPRDPHDTTDRVRRRTSPVLVAAAFVAVLAVGTAVTTWFALSAESARRDAALARALTRDKEREATLIRADLLCTIQPGIGSMSDTAWVPPSLHAWELREQADATRDLAAYANLLLLISRSEEMPEGTRARFIHLVPEAIDHILTMDPHASVSAGHGVVAHMWGDRSQAWRIGVGLCDELLNHLERRADPDGIRRCRLQQRDLLLSVERMTMNEDELIYDGLIAFVRWATDAGEPELALEIEDGLMAAAEAASSMGSGGPWRKPEVRALLAKALWRSGNRVGALELVSDQIRSLSYETDGVYSVFKSYAMQSLLEMLEESERSASELAELLRELLETDEYRVDAFRDTEARLATLLDDLQLD